jgi:mono/diheme cytochrome c family protein
MRRGLLSATSILLVVGWSAGAPGPGLAQTEQVDYLTDVRPILSGYCYQCHGEDSSTREAELRLDLKEFAFADLGGYPNIVPGDPDDSELYIRVSAPIAEERMPPYQAGTMLSQEQIETIRTWIEQGAEWPDDPNDPNDDDDNADDDDNDDD